MTSLTVLYQGYEMVSMVVLDDLVMMGWDYVLWIFRWNNSWDWNYFDGCDYGNIEGRFAGI